jgi:hypothetical protein
VSAKNVTSGSSFDSFSEFSFDKPQPEANQVQSDQYSPIEVDQGEYVHVTMPTSEKVYIYVYIRIFIYIYINICMYIYI